MLLLPIPCPALNIRRFAGCFSGAPHVGGNGMLPGGPRSRGDGLRRERLLHPTWPDRRGQRGQKTLCLPYGGPLHVAAGALQGSRLLPWPPAGVMRAHQQAAWCVQRLKHSSDSNEERAGEGGCQAGRRLAAAPPSGLTGQQQILSWRFSCACRSATGVPELVRGAEQGTATLVPRAFHQLQGHGHCW